MCIPYHGSPGHNYFIICYRLSTISRHQLIARSSLLTLYIARSMHARAGPADRCVGRGVGMSKRPRRAAALEANKRTHSTNCVVAECANVHLSKSIALTSQDVLESAERDVLYRGQLTTVVTLFCNARPKGLPRGTVHVGAAFDDSPNFDDAILQQHLDSVVARIETAGTDRVVFVCQAGVNRSTLALCYYCAKHGSCGGWEEAKVALVRAKGHASAGWPTLSNHAFEGFLCRCFSTGGGSSSSSSTERPLDSWGAE